jgi:uncharacterized membrane protein YqaE (UPF0057 family)
MSGTGCSGLEIRNYYSKSEMEHDNYCTNNDPNLFDCIRSEGCMIENGVCKLNVGKSLGSAYINGGFGFGKLCLDHEFTRLILLFLFPPAYVYLKESKRGFTDKRSIILSVIYTSLFYVPGLIHALQYKHSYVA